MGELNNNASIHSTEHQYQVQKDAIYQAIDMWVCNDEEQVDLKGILENISRDLERPEPDYVLVKARASRLLAKVSDWDAMRKDHEAQHRFMTTVVNMFPADEKAPVDILLSMNCLYYF